jgi:CheY-like chemotaxis protein
MTRAPLLPLTVLVADDDEGIRALLQMALPLFGLTVLVAVDGEEAIETYRRLSSTIDLVLLDVQMPPGMDGPEAAPILRTLNPDLRFCFMSGDSGTYSTAALLALGAVRVFHKPFPDLEAFARELRELAPAR